MSGISKKEADAHDRILNAAAELVELIELADIEIKEDSLEELAIYLARNASQIKNILTPLKRWSKNS
jgi:dsDNA-binding SOS-regulon protein